MTGLLGHCEYTNYSQTNDWFCINCGVTLHPFNHLSDDNLFQLYANVNSLPDNVGIDKIARLNSNPFTLSKRNIVTGNDYDIDPDINLYDCLTPQKNKYFVENAYISIINGNKTDCNFSNNIKIYNHNIKSFSKILPELINHLSNLESEFQIITLTETWCTPFNEHLIGIEGYTFVQSRSNGLRGERVAVMIKQNLKASHIDLECYKTALFELLAVNIQISNTYKQDIIVFVVYRPPGQDTNNFVDIIISIIKTLSNAKKTCYICEDFNIDLLNYDNHTVTQLFRDTFMSFSFRPLINVRTRITESTSTLIV